MTDGLLRIELAYYDKSSNRYEVLAPDIGKNPLVEFELNDTTLIRAYVRVYPGFQTGGIIYKEE